jgi:hypothetical protein
VSEEDELRELLTKADAGTRTAFAAAAAARCVIHRPQNYLTPLWQTLSRSPLGRLRHLALELIRPADVAAAASAVQRVAVALATPAAASALSAHEASALRQAASHEVRLRPRPYTETRQLVKAARPHVKRMAAAICCLLREL